MSADPRLVEDLCWELLRALKDQEPSGPVDEMSGGEWCRFLDFPHGLLTYAEEALSGGEHEH